jgi:hypothetical protein
MAEVETKVQTVWEVVDHTTSHIKNMTEAAERFKGIADRAKSVAMGLFAYAGIEASVHGVIKFAEGLIRVNSELEKGRLNLGGMLWTVEQLYGGMGVRNFNEAIAKGAKLYEELEKHAAKAVGTTEDYTRALQAVLQPIAAAGGGLQEALEVSKLLVPTAQALNIPLEVASYSIKQALLGMLDARDMLVAQLGLHHEVLNTLARQGKQAEVLKMLLEALRRNQELAAAAGELWEARLATVEDIVKKIKRIMGEELFNAAKKTIDEFEKWYNKNEEHIREWAKNVGTDLVNAFNKVVEAVKWIAKHWEEITTIIKTLVEIWIAKKFAEGLTNLIGLVGQLKQGFMGLFIGQAGGKGNNISSFLTGIAFGGASDFFKTGGPAEEGTFKGVVKQFGQEMADIGEAGLFGLIAGGAQGALLFTAGAAAYKGAKYTVGNFIDLIKTTDYKREVAEMGLQVKKYRLQKELEKILTAVPADLLKEVEDKIIKQWRGNRSLKIGEVEQFKQSLQFYEKLLKSLAELGYTAKQVTQETGGFKTIPLGFIGAMHKDVEELMKRPPEGKPPVIDMRGSKIEIKMDVRHLDPDRVAAAVMTGLSRAANRKIASKVPYPYLVSG